MEGSPYMDDDIALLPSLKLHETKSFQPIPVAYILAATDMASEDTLCWL